MLASGATFLARGYSGSLELLKRVFREAIFHKGFALVDVLQVCATFFNMYDYYNKKVYELKEHDPTDYGQVSAKIKEWDYNSDAPIALGVLYRKLAPTFEGKLEKPGIDPTERQRRLDGLLKPGLTTA
jgi:2-oxoglutarate ferredoxin oxidoreductase subunit beta